MPFALLLGIALLTSVAVPAALLMAGPVVERRATLATSYASIFSVAWLVALPLGFMHPGAVAVAIVALTSLIALAALHAWGDERLLARFDRRVQRSDTRAEALEEVRTRIDALAKEGRSPVGLMEIAGFPVRRLVAHGCYQEVLSVLAFVEERMAAHPTALDASELRVLRTRVLLHLGRPAEAAATLALETRVGSRYPRESSLLGALMAACDRSKPQKEPVRPCWSAWEDALARLVRAHHAAARGDEASAIRQLCDLPKHPYGPATLDLARAHPGPATPLAARLAGSQAPYR